MDLEIINKLFLELSQVATAKTANEVFLIRTIKKANDILRSAYAIADRNGECVNWEYFRNRLKEVLEEQHKIMYQENYSHTFSSE